MIQELIERYEKRKKECFKFPNPYYVNPKLEYKEICEKISELKLKITK